MLARPIWQSLFIRKLHSRRRRIPSLPYTASRVPGILFYPCFVCSRYTKDTLVPIISDMTTYDLLPKVTRNSGRNLVIFFESEGHRTDTKSKRSMGISSGR